MADGVASARLFASTWALLHWPGLLRGGEYERVEAWNTFAIGHDARVVVTSPGPLREPQPLRVDEASPYPKSWTSVVIHEWVEARWTSTELLLHVQGPPLVQPLPHARWLVQAGDRGDQVYPLAHRGVVARTYRIGWGAATMQATSTGRAWLGYSEQAILGTDLGSAALAAFGLDGAWVFDLRDIAPASGLPVPLNLNAVNVVSDYEMWALGSGEYGILIKLHDLSVVQSWVWNNAEPNPEAHGPVGNAIAVDGQRVLVGKDLRSDVLLVDLATRAFRRMGVVYDGHPLTIERVIGRGKRLWCMSDQILYTVDLDDVPQYAG